MSFFFLTLYVLYKSTLKECWASSTDQPNSPKGL